MTSAMSYKNWLLRVCRLIFNATCCHPILCQAFLCFRPRYRFLCPDAQLGGRRSPRKGASSCRFGPS
ncbi:hypothetical protein BC834DRAFT_901472 [Gloeopeniophorella convolvens]|nr:hypothetical protein BC834DRAFT_901472 [Gloeopeniophorella convolvens]